MSSCAQQHLAAVLVLAVSSSLPYEYATSADPLCSRPSCSIHSLGVVVRYGLDAALYTQENPQDTYNFI